GGPRRPLRRRRPGGRPLGPRRAPATSGRPRRREAGAFAAATLPLADPLADEAPRRAGSVAGAGAPAEASIAAAEHRPSASVATVGCPLGESPGDAEFRDAGRRCSVGGRTAPAPAPGRAAEAAAVADAPSGPHRSVLAAARGPRWARAARAPSAGSAR